MQDITQQITSYLEAKRHLWNTYFRTRIKSIKECHPLDEYEEIDRLLFSALVLGDLKQFLPDNFVFGRDIIPFLKIVPNPEIDGFELMITDPTVEKYVKWNKPVEVKINAGVEFTFIELFEWDRYGFVNYPYYLTKITKYPDSPELVQQNALIEIGKAKVICDDVKRGADRKRRDKPA